MSKLRGSENGNRYAPTGVEELTHSGQMISLLDPRPDQIRMSDIATSLAAQVRFNGHCPLQPTIAQHSLAVEYIAGTLWQRRQVRLTATPRALLRAALCHDAAEYLVGDSIGAVKKLMRQPSFLHDGMANSFDKLEARVQWAIVKRFNCSDEGWEDIIHEADCIACAYEMSWDDWCDTAKSPEWLLDCDRTSNFRLNSIYEPPNWRTGMYDGGEAAFLFRASQLGMVDDA